MKKQFKSCLGLLLVLTLMFSLTGCGEVEQAENAINGMFTSFKALDFEGASEYVNVNDILSTETANTNSANGELFMQTLFNRLEYTIVSSEKIDSDTVIVKTEITAIDMKPVLAEWITNAMKFAFQNAFASDSMSEDETNQIIEQMFVEAVSKDGLATITNTVDVSVVKVDGKWNVQVDEQFADIIFGGLIAATESLSNSFNTETGE